MRRPKAPAARLAIVPVWGAPGEEDAFRLACRLARRGRGRVVVVYTIRAPRRLPVDALMEEERREADEALQHYERLGADEDTPTETMIIQARQMAPAVVEEARRQGADLIVTPAGRQRHGVFSISPDALHLLENAPCPVILWHDPEAVLTEGEE